MIGGTSNPDGTNADPGSAPAVDGKNRFQGRYIIRHFWEGPVQCEHPHYGLWTGPPSDPVRGYRQTPGVAAGSGAPKTAGDLAQAPRGVYKLTSVVRSPVPSLQLKGIPRPPLRKGEMPVTPR